VTDTFCLLNHLDGPMHASSERNSCMLAAPASPNAARLVAWKRKLGYASATPASYRIVSPASRLPFHGFGVSVGGTRCDMADQTLPWHLKPHA